MKILLACFFLVPLLAQAREAERITVLPKEVRLSDARARQQLLVTVRTSEGYLVDATREATFTAADAAIAEVDRAGIVRPRRQGKTVIRVIAHGGTVEVPITVEGLEKPRPVSFTNEVMALVSKSGCNAGTCHGHFKGKGDFKLSLWGRSPDADHGVIARRVDRDHLDDSLILQKPTAQQSHRGGKRFDVDSDSYRLLHQWVREGAKKDPGDAPRLERVEVLPGSTVIPRPGLSQQLVVRAHFSGGVTRDVTNQALYELSSEGVLTVTPQGLVTAQREGESAILIRFIGTMSLARFLVIRHKPDFRWTDPPSHNFIDRHVNAKLKAIQALPSELSDDAEFLRRLHLDMTGLPPRADEVRAFLADRQQEKRPHKIDEVLNREEFGEQWASYWAELSGVTESGASAGRKGLWLWSQWMCDAVNKNMPYDQFVREMLTARGSSFEKSAMTFGITRVPKAEVVPQLFLGVRLQCAECHDHPFDTWKQVDYQSVGTFFADIRFKEGPHDSGGREGKYFVAPERFLPWEKDKTIDLRLLDGQTAKVSIQRDRREVLLDWMFGPAKKLAARALVNRVWGRFMGRGIVEPVDDMRFSNPAVNDPLLDALADDFIAHKYDFKQLVRTILRSHTYQRTSRTNATNATDRMNFSHALLRRLSAEQLLDAICFVTGVNEESRGVSPEGMRAGQLPYENSNSRFLALFGRPGQRSSPCECIRSREPTLPQLLHLLNGDTVGSKLRTPDGTLSRLLKLHDDGVLVEELYLTVLNRLPGGRERTLAVEHLRGGKDRVQRAEDLMWALVAGEEFLFNH